MKDLKDILSESLLKGMEETLDEKIDLNILYESKSEAEFYSRAKIIKSIVESEGNGPLKPNQLKKGKSYIFIWEDTDWEGEWVVAFVDKFPIADEDLYLDDMYYNLFWDDYYGETMIKLDDTGNEFRNLIEQDFGHQSMQGAYEMPKDFVKSMRKIIKDATGY